MAGTVTNRTTIVLKGGIDDYEEGRAAAGLTGKILPGYLIELNGDSELQRHSTAGGPAEKLIAIEDGLIGMTVTGNVPPDGGVVAGGLAVGYVAGNLVRHIVAVPFKQVQVMLKAGQTADEDDFLTSNGDGTVKVATSTDVRLFKAMEPLDLSGGGAVDTLIAARSI